MKNNVLVIGIECLPILYNRDGGLDGGWIHIVPKGELFNKEAGVTQVLDDKALDSIIANLNADKHRLGIRWPGLYMGEEHFIYDSSKSSEAFVWAKEFEKRDDGIWAKGEVTDVGEPAIKNRRFKFTSFVTDPQTPGSVEALSGNKFRILRVETVGFTNFANGRDLLTPIMNRSDERPQFRHGLSGSAADNKPNQRKQMKSVCALLGLSADADESSVHAAVSKMLNRGDITVADLTTLQNRKTELEEDNTALLDDQIAGLLTERKVTDKALQNRLTAILKPLKNRDERVACLDELQVGTEEKEEKPAGQQRLLNRDGTKTPKGGKEKPADVTPTQLNSEVRKIMNRDGVKFEPAYNILMQEKPELFGKQQ